MVWEKMDGGSRVDVSSREGWILGVGCYVES